MRIAIGVLSLLPFLSIALAQEPTSTADLPVQVRTLTINTNDLPDADKLRIVHAFEGQTYPVLELRQRVRQNLRDHGYYQARVEAPELTDVVVTPQLRAATVTLKISGGLQFKFGEIHFSESSAFTQEQLKSLFAIEPGSEFNASAVGDGLERIAKLYRMNGYEDIGVIPNPEIDTAHRTVGLTMVIEEGKPSYFGRLALLGTEPREGVGNALTAAWSQLEGKRYNPELFAEWLAANAPFIPDAETAPEQFVAARRDPGSQNFDFQIRFP